MRSTDKLKRTVRTLLRIPNQAIAPLDRLIARDAGQFSPPLFIVGSPRSGTTIVYQAVTQQIDVGYFISISNYLYEASNVLSLVLRPFMRRPAPIFESRFGKTPGWLAPAENGNFWFRWFPRDGALGHYVPPENIAIEDYAGLRRAVASLTAIGGRPMVFKSVYLTMVAGVLAQVLPEALFLFVKRERFYTCQSLLLARQACSGSHGWWSVKVPGYRDFLSRPLWEQVVEQVARTESILEDHIRRYAPGRYMELQYDEFCRDPRRVIGNIARWLAPAGYRAYPDTRIPRTFHLSRQTKLPDDLAERLHAKLREVESALDER